MLKNYVDLLKKGIDALTGLSIKDATISDYFMAVGYEFAIILLGIFYLVIAMFIIAAPFILTKMFCKNRYDELYSTLSKFPSLYRVDKSERYGACKYAFRRLQEPVSHNKMSTIKGGTEISKLLEELNTLSNGFRNYPGPKNKEIETLMSKIKKAESNFQIEEQRIKAWKLYRKDNTRIFITYVVAYFIWALFVIPVVMMFF